MSRRKRNKRLITIAIMLILCLLAGLYIVKTVGRRAEEAKEAELAAEAEAAAQAEAEQAAEEERAKENAVKYEKVCAYRGSSSDSLYTMNAYDNATEAGASTLILPFVVSQDDTLYVSDDDYAQELTGYGGYFSGMRDSQIDNLETKAGTKVLKLSEVFEKYGGDKNYVLELKYTSVRNLEALRRFIEQSGHSDKISISCRYFNGLRSMETYLPDTPKIFVCSDEAEFGEALSMDQIDSIAVSREIMAADLCKSAHDYDKKFGAWTLNTEEDIKAAAEIGADFFFTDEAALAVGLQ